MDDCGKIQLFFIRHGFSCSNYFKRRFKIKKTKKDYAYGAYAMIPDPEVSNQGLADLMRARPYLNIPNKPSIVLSSTLLRAMETAKVLFPEYKVYSVPYIGETAGVVTTPDNEPTKPSEQNQVMRNLTQGQRHVIYSYLDERSDYPMDMGSLDREFSRRGKSLSKPDFDKFLRWLEKWLPTAKEWNERYENRKFTIVVVGHSNFMRKFMQKEGMFNSQNSNKEDKPQNAAVVEVNLCSKGGKLVPYVKNCPQINTFHPHRKFEDDDQDDDDYQEDEEKEEVGDGYHIDVKYDIVRETKQPKTIKDFLCYGIRFYGIPEPDIDGSGKGYENCDIGKAGYIARYINK